MKKVFIYGFYGIDNVGNEAMLNALIKPIREHFKSNVEFVVSNRHPSKTYDEYYGVRSIQNLEYPSRDMAMGRWLRGLNPDDSNELMVYLKEIGTSDLVIIGPGQYLVETGEFGLLKGSLAQLMVVAELSLLTNTPLYGLALACEPLKTPWSILLINQILGKFNRLTFRDAKSIENLQSVGIQMPKYEVLGDLALAAKPSGKENLNKIIKQENLKITDVPRLAVALRSIYWLQDFDENAWLERVKTLVEKWLDHFPNGEVVFVPQNTYHIDSDRDDDRRVNAHVVNQLADKYKDRVVQIAGEYFPQEIEAVYGICDITLSARLHGSVFSCKQRTPPIVYEFMDKSTGFFDRLGLPELLVPLDINTDELFEKIISIYNEKKNYQNFIDRSVTEIHKTASNYSKIAIELLEIEKDKRNSAVDNAILSIE